ncbi:MAG: lysophospholipid acyltransferase family protein [Planctomycetota bacterium]
MSEQPATHPDLPAVSARWVRWALWYIPRLVRKNFSAARLLGDLPDVVKNTSGGQPLLIYLNHPSWWDPIAVGVLKDRFFRDRRSYGPIDGKGLEKYRLMEKLGFFGIDPDSRAGAAAFLRVGRAAMSTPGSVLWVTAEGHFTDPRKRPVRLRPGVAHLVRKAAGGVALPLAVEYPFGEEKQPEMRLAFGEPIVLGGAEHEGKPRTAAEWNTLLEDRLTEAMDRLAAATIARDHDAFTLLCDGKRGVGGVYDVWRRLKAVFAGKKFDPSHGTSAD